MSNEATVYSFGSDVYPTESLNDLIQNIGDRFPSRCKRAIYRVSQEIEYISVLGDLRRLFGTILVSLKINLRHILTFHATRTFRSTCVQVIVNWGLIVIQTPKVQINSWTIRNCTSLGSLGSVEVMNSSFGYLLLYSPGNWN